MWCCWLQTLTTGSLIPQWRLTALSPLHSCPQGMGAGRCHARECSGFCPSNFIHTGYLPGSWEMRTDTECTTHSHFSVGPQHALPRCGNAGPGSAVSTPTPHAPPPARHDSWSFSSLTEAILSLNTLPPPWLACSLRPKSLELGELRVSGCHIAVFPVTPSTLVGSGIGPWFPPSVLVSAFFFSFSVALPALPHDSCVYVFVEADD